MKALPVSEPRMNSNVVPPKFAARSVEEIQAELVGFPVSCVEAALRFHASGDVEDLLAMLPGIIEFHLPSAAQNPLPPLEDTLRRVIREELQGQP